KDKVEKMPIENTSVDYQLIGERIKYRRKEMHKTQENLAELLNVSVGYVSQIERGITKVNLDTLSKISEILSCDMVAFIENSITKKPDYLSDEFYQVYSLLDNRKKSLLLKLAEDLRDL
ncbi:MAG: helix-turn-helix transcriptional regulator, partial [Christensenellaceae bacterium]